MNLKKKKTLRVVSQNLSNLLHTCVCFGMVYHLNNTRYTKSCFHLNVIYVQPTSLYTLEMTIEHDCTFNIKNVISGQTNRPSGVSLKKLVSLFLG